MAVRFGVIGAGAIGRLRAETVAAHPRTTLIAVADVDEGAAHRTGQTLGAAVYDRYERMLDRGGLDAVIISSPAPLHEAMCIDALRAGCHVLVEKPLAPRIEACERIMNTAHEASRTLAVGFNHRFYPAMRFVKETLTSDRIGEVDHLKVYGGHDGLANFRADWMYQSELSGGGAMMDVGIHMSDLTRFLIGEIEEVYAVATNRVWKVDGSEDNAMAIFKTTRGVPVQFHATWNAWKGYEVSVEAYGNRGMVRGAYAPMFNLLITQPEPGGPRKKTYRTYPEIILNEKLRGWQTTTRATFTAELDDFLLMIAGAPTHLADGWSGLRAVEIANAVWRSTNSGRPVQLRAPA